MFWYKSWLDTRWRFLIAFVVLVCSAVLTVLAYPKVLGLLPLAERVDLGGEIGRRVSEIVQLERDYRGYIWVQSFRQNLTQMGTLFAVLLGAGGLLPSGSRDTALFTMSLPASRNELLGSRAATGLLELGVLAFAPALVFPLLSPTVGQSFSVGSAIVHGACLFITWAVFFSLALLLSTVVAGIWIPAVVAICVGFFLMAVDLGRRRYGAIQHLCGDERRALLPHRHAAVGWPGRECRGCGRDAVRRRPELRTPGLLNAVHDGDGADRREYRWTPPVGKVRSEYQLFDVDPPRAPCVERFPFDVDAAASRARTDCGLRAGNHDASGAGDGGDAAARVLDADAAGFRRWLRLARAHDESADRRNPRPSGHAPFRGP